MKKTAKRRKAGGKRPSLQIGHGKVLVVDDEPWNRRLIRNMIESAGLTVFEADDGACALRRARGLLPDVILLDVLMPGMDGFETCRRLKADQRTSMIPVIMVTSLSERKDRLAGIEAGADDFLEKPVDREEVLLRVRNCIRARKLYDKLAETCLHLREIEYLRDNLTNMILHDMKSPVMAISVCQEMLARGDVESDMALKRKFTNTISASASRLIEMIAALLDVARIESGTMPLDKTVCDLVSVVEEGIGAWPQIDDEALVRMDAPAGPVHAFCDANLVRRVVINLVGNAKKFSPPGSEIIVTVDGFEGYGMVTVSDLGPGIPQEYREKIFEKSGQVAARGERKVYSAGLGLTFCKLAVEAHGGSIGVESEAGLGSDFWFTLPVAVPARACATAGWDVGAEVEAEHCVAG